MIIHWHNGCHALVVVVVPSSAARLSAAAARGVPTTLAQSQQAAPARTLCVRACERACVHVGGRASALAQRMSEGPMKQGTSIGNGGSAATGQQGSSAGRDG